MIYTNGMDIKELKIPGVFEIQLKQIRDERGFFMRTYEKRVFENAGIDRKWVEENHSLSKIKGTVRGLHFQFQPDSQTKLVRVSSGELMDVYIDLRKNSSTFGQWGSIILSGEIGNMIYIPKGFAHGICTLRKNCDLLYKVDKYYNSKNESTIRWNDPDIGIKWPIKNPTVISERDKNAQSFKEFAEKYGGL